MAFLTIQITTPDAETLLLRLESAGITLFDILQGEDYVLRFRIRRSQLAVFRRLADRSGLPWKIIGKQGIYWALRRLLHRPVLVLGAVLLCALSLWVPSRIFFVQVQGNVTVPAQQIVQIATNCGISFGAPTSAVHAQQVKHTLMNALPQLQWAGVETKGCLVLITVREGSPPPTGGTNLVGSIIADRDGVIWDMTVLQGNALCTPGQAVKAGQTLISGYTDCGLTIRATRAQGDVYAYTNRVLTAVTPTIWSKWGECRTTEKKYSLIIGKKRINFSNSSGILGSTCAKIYTENYLTLPGGFRLPIGIAMEAALIRERQTVTVADSAALLTDFAARYLRAQMQAGQVLSGSRNITEENGLCRLEGVYSCREMIGRFRPEENLPNYETD